MKYIRILDTTLRDGEQAPGFAITKEDKIMFAKQLETLGVDAIEAGFPVSSSQDFEAVQEIAKVCRKTEVVVLARCNKKDIDCAIKSLAHAVKPRINVFIGTSEMHLKHKLKMTQNEALAKLREGVRLARVFTPRILCGSEDATRSDRQFLVKVFEAAIEEGADIISVADTVGYATPEEYGELIRFLKENVKGVEKATISAHCHNDLGLAVANALAAVLNGAGQVDCTINGIGERAGNAALEEVVMAIKTRPDIYHAKTSVDSTKLVSISQLLEKITGHKVPPNKAIVGKNAFAHGSGIHQHGVLAHQGTYQIIDPKEVGFASMQIVLTKHSGKHALIHRLQELDVDVKNLDIEDIFVAFKSLAGRKKSVYDEDLMRLIKDKKRL